MLSRIPGVHNDARHQRQQHAAQGPARARLQASNRRPAHARQERDRRTTLEIPGRRDVRLGRPAQQRHIAAAVANICVYRRHFWHRYKGLHPKCSPSILVLRRHFWHRYDGLHPTCSPVESRSTSSCSTWTPRRWPSVQLQRQNRLLAQLQHTRTHGCCSTLALPNCHGNGCWVHELEWFRCASHVLASHHERCRRVARC